MAEHGGDFFSVILLQDDSVAGSEDDFPESERRSVAKACEIKGAETTHGRRYVSILAGTTNGVLRR